MNSIKYEPIETYYGDVDLNGTSLHYNLDSGSEKNNTSKKENSDSHEKDSSSNNPLFNINTLQSLRISHSTDKSTDSQTLINRINGIKCLDNKMIKEKESDLCIDMYELLNNKENDINNSNIIEITNTKNPYANNLNKNKNSNLNIKFNKNINSNKNINKSINANKNQNKIINSTKNLSQNKITKNTTSNRLKQQINIQQLFKKKFEEKANQISKKITLKNSINNSNNSSLLRTKISHDSNNHKDFSILTENNNNNISQTYLKKVNNNHLINSLNKNAKKTIEFVDDKSIRANGLDKYFFNKKIQKNKKVYSIKQKPDSKKYILSCQNSFNKNKNKQSVKNSFYFLNTSIQKNKNNSRIIYNKTEIYPHIKRHKTNNHIFKKNSVPKKTKNSSNSCKTDKVELINKYFMNNKSNSFFQEKSQGIKHTTKAKTSKRKLNIISSKNLSLNKIKPNNKITKRNDISVYFINYTKKIPSNFNKRIQYLNLSKDNSKQVSVNLNHSIEKNKLITNKIHSMKTMKNIFDKNQKKNVIKDTSQKTKQQRYKKELEIYFKLVNDIMTTTIKKISTNINNTQRSHKNINMSKSQANNNAVKYFLNNKCIV